jgi:hypothetical protein
MISALPFLLLMAVPDVAPAGANVPPPPQRLAAAKAETAVRAQVTILRAAIVSASPPKDGAAQTDREYHRRMLVPMVEFY